MTLTGINCSACRCHEPVNHLNKYRARARAEPLHRQPEPPDGLAEFEQHVMAADAPAVVLIDRALVRALLRYVRRLERQYDLLPPDHPAREAAEPFAVVWWS